MATDLGATHPRAPGWDSLCETVARECGIPRHLFDGSRDNHATTTAVFRRLNEMAVERLGVPMPPEDGPSDE